MWKWIEFAGSDRPIPARFSDRSNLAVEYMDTMLRRSDTDFAFWWGPADRGMWGFDFNYLKQYDASSYTKADFQTHRRMAETMTGSLTGAELKDIWNRWGRDRQLLCKPEISFRSITDEERYRISIPMDLYIKLGQRRKALIDPKPGPLISSTEIREEIFRQ